jgi:hypothetical protein
VDSASLPEAWECALNTWDPENSSCAAPQDYYDPDSENTIQTSGGGGAEVALEARPGDWRDVFCTKNKVYYEAQVMAVRGPHSQEEVGTGSDAGKPKQRGKRKAEGHGLQLLFHFLGWSSKFDEWIDATSDRIAAHRLYTNPMSRRPRDQERWQGVSLTERPPELSGKSKSSKGSRKDKRLSSESAESSAKKKKVMPL